MCVEEKRARIRPKRRWIEILKNDMKRTAVCEDDANDRSKWKMNIDEWPPIVGREGKVKEEEEEQNTLKWFQPKHCRVKHEIFVVIVPVSFLERKKTEFYRLGRHRVGNIHVGHLVRSMSFKCTRPSFERVVCAPET